jgi:hypothetical protein
VNNKNKFNLFCILAIILFFRSPVFLQQYEYYGIVKLNDKLEQSITYKIVFSEINGKIKGYSITDIQGDHETKSEIEGNYNKSKKLFSFNEKTIVYTKSKISQNSFCFINYSGKLDLLNPKAKLEGKFSGFFTTKTRCIDGSLLLVNQSKMEKFLKKVEKTMDKTKKIDSKTKEANNPNKLFDSLMINRLTKDQNINIFSTSKKVEINIWDAKISDGDAISFYHNDVLVVNNHVMTNDKYKIERRLLPGVNIFKIQAINQGKTGLNTLMVECIGDKVITLESSLKTNEQSTISIINQ